METEDSHVYEAILTQCFLLIEIYPCESYVPGKSKVISVATTNAKVLRSSLPLHTDHDAWRVIAERSKEAEVYAMSYKPRKNEWIEGKLEIVKNSIKGMKGVTESSRR
ncbi:hypothetical protein P3X46_021851 [Hevea brasiliensis]|uniref:Uncharacterized protein n=1 Tax=Hevea brasiliensis TaxID=3981 RepID=A0ABQ9LKM0_HEVBR|nr:hypothetical protein P3X46_021851 [Hevea brasiliensis]